MALTQAVAYLMAVVALAAAAAPAAAWGEGDWVDARATFYGRDAWSLHEGSCGFGFVCPNRWSGQLKSGYDLVALSDKSPLYNGKASCGQCLELSCRDANIRDGFGNTYDRVGMCKGGPGHYHVKVKVADTCPCNYAANAESNKRWCCGDYPHLDVSQWALEKITSDTSKWGVFAIQYRTVSCDANIEKEAPNPANLPADPHYSDKPSDLNCASQGLATESVTSSRASVTKKSNHSKKYYARKAAYADAKKRKHSAKYYKALAAYFAKRGPNMKRLDGKPPGSAK